MLAPERQGTRRERRERRVVVLPVEPGEFVVLAVSVVVAELRPPDLVAPKQHRHALREGKRRDEVPLLARSQRVDLRIVRRALDAVVPRAVVVLPAAIGPIRLVVLVVVRDEV